MSNAKKYWFANGEKNELWFLTPKNRRILIASFVIQKDNIAVVRNEFAGTPIDIERHMTLPTFWGEEQVADLKETIEDIMNDYFEEQSQFFRDMSFHFENAVCSDDAPEVFQRELDIVTDVLYAHLIDDVELDIDANGVLVVTDSMNNTWYGPQIYEFIANEVLVYEDDNSISVLRRDLHRDFAELAEAYGVTVHLPN